MNFTLAMNLTNIVIRKALGLSTWAARRAFVRNLKISVELGRMRARAEAAELERRWLESRN